MEFRFYKVVFNGVIDPKKDRVDVASRFSKKSRLSLRRVDGMFSSDEAVTIKTDLSKDKAEALKAKLNKIGMRTTVIALEIEPEAIPEAVSPPVLELSSADVVAEHQTPKNKTAGVEQSGFACPKCGQVQKKTTQCISCGIYFSKLDQPEVAVDTGVSEQVVDASSADKPSRSYKDLLGGSKGMLVWVVGIGAVLFVLLKKFGVLKAVFVAASLGLTFDSVVDESITLCLGDSQCEVVVRETAEDCWIKGGMDQYDWDAMSDSEFDQHYKELEQSFFSCLVYPDGQNLFLRPAFLTAMLVNFCEYDGQCMMEAGRQQRQCYQEHSMGLHTDGLIKLGYDEAFSDYSNELWAFMGCFVDADNEPLFSDYIYND